MNTLTVICQHCGHLFHSVLVGEICPLCGNTLTNHTLLVVRPTTQPLRVEQAWYTGLAA